MSKCCDFYMRNIIAKIARIITIRFMNDDMGTL